MLSSKRKEKKWSDSAALWPPPAPPPGWFLVGASRLTLGSIMTVLLNLGMRKVKLFIIPVETNLGNPGGNAMYSLLPVNTWKRERRIDQGSFLSCRCRYQWRSV